MQFDKKRQVGCKNNGNFTGAHLDKNLYSQLTRIENSPLADAFFSKENIDAIQNALIREVNRRIREANPQSKCAISRQSDREVMLLMIEFFHYFATQISSAGRPFFVGRKNSVYNQVPVPATFMFSDPSNTYMPGWYKPEKDGNYNCGRKNYYNNHYLKRHLPDTIPQRCVGNEHYYTDVPYYNEDIPIPYRVASINKKFIEFFNSSNVGTTVTLEGSFFLHSVFPTSW